MRKLFGLMVVGGLIAFVATDSNAQRPGGGFGFGQGGGFALLTNKGVQEELKITDEQKEKITAASKELFKGGGFKKDQTKEDREKARKEREEATKKAIADILKPEQVKRFKQIERQQDVVATLTTDADAAKEFKLTDEQKEKIKGLVEDNRKEMPKFSFGGKDGGKFDQNALKEFQEKTAALRKELKEKTLKVLTEDQMKVWKEMTGAPFEVKLEGFGGGIRKKKDD